MKEAASRRSRRGWFKRHKILGTVLTTVSSSLIVAAALGMQHWLAGSGKSAAAETSAERIATCMSEHHMTDTTEGPAKPPSGIDAPFSSVNRNRYMNGDPAYGSGPIPVDMFELCSMAPSPWC